MHVQCSFNVRSHVRTFNARSMHIKCAFNAFTMRTSVVMRFLCAYNAFSVRAIRVMRFLCAHNASSVREIRILRVKYVFCTREIRILRVKYVFCSHKIRILHARSIPAADIDSNEIYADSQSGGRPFSDECKKPAIVCRDQISMRFEDSMYIQLYISVHTTIHKPQNCCSLTSPEHSHERRKSIAGGGSESGPSPFSV